MTTQEILKALKSNPAMGREVLQSLYKETFGVPCPEPAATEEVMSDTDGVEEYLQKKYEAAP